MGLSTSNLKLLVSIEKIMIVGKRAQDMEIERLIPYLANWKAFSER
jgi:hypothetical protein